ncbi:MAG: hypothetical protein GY940_39865, partial [bacterium]|nr:hypothetical protein [bacterium]
ATTLAGSTRARACTPAGARPRSSALAAAPPGPAKASARYKSLQWRRDIVNGRPLKVIIPVVFYHGKDKWNVPDQFIDLFKVDEEIKPLMLNFKYFLFDTDDWDFRTETDPELSENVFLLTAMALMKYSYNKDMDAIEEIIRFWYKKGFIQERQHVVFFLIYISQSYNIQHKQMLEIFDRNNIKEGGEIMQTLAEEIIGNAREEAREEAIKETQLETARSLTEQGVDINIIVNATGLSKEEIGNLAKTIHKSVGQ